MILDDGAVLQLGGGVGQWFVGEIDAPLLEVRPSQAVEIRGIARFDFERAPHQLHGFLEPILAFGQQAQLLMIKVAS